MGLPALAASLLKQPSDGPQRQQCQRADWGTTGPLENLLFRNLEKLIDCLVDGGMRLAEEGDGLAVCPAGWARLAGVHVVLIGGH